MIDNIFRQSFYSYLFFYPLIPTTFGKYHISDLFMALFIIAFMIKSFYNKKERKEFLTRAKDLTKDKVFLTMIFSVTFMCLSMVYASDKNIAIFEGIRYFTYIILYIAIKYEFNIKNKFNKFKFILTLQAGLVFLFGIIQYLTGFGVNSVVDTEGTIRMEGTLGHPNALAAYIILMIFPLILFAINEKNKKYKVVYSIIILFGIIDLILSWSRNAWLSLVVGFVVLAIIYNYKFLYGIFAAALTAFIVPFTRVRLLSLTSSTINGGRIKLWKAALKMVEDHPIRGVGNGNFSLNYDSYCLKYPELYAEGHNGFPTHNSYLKIWSELGTIGIMVFFSTYIITFFRLLKANKKYKKKYSGFTTAVLVSFIAFMFSNLFDNLLFTPKVMTIFICLISLCITIDTRRGAI